MTGRCALERLAQHEPGLRQRALARVDEQQHAVDHEEAALDLAAEVGVTGRVDDVDLHVAVLHRGVLGEDRDPLLTLEVHRVHDPVGDLRLARKVPVCQSMASTSVVLPWSTWAMIATLRSEATSDVSWELSLGVSWRADIAGPFENERDRTTLRQRIADQGNQPGYSGYPPRDEHDRFRRP